MSVQVHCSSCERGYTIPDDLIGKKIRCKGCQAVFLAQPLTPDETRPARSLPREAIQADVPKLCSRSRDFDEEDEDNRPRRRPRIKRPVRNQSTAVWITAIVCGLLALVCGLGLLWVLLRSEQREAAVQEAIAQRAAQNARGNRPAIPPPNLPDNEPMPIKVAAEPEPAGLYGDQGGDPIAPADPHLPNTAMRARAEDSFYRLSNPRVGQPNFGPGQALLIDYEVTRRGKHNGGSLVIHGGDGRRTNVALIIFGQQDRGTLEVKTFGPFHSFPQNAELYLVRGDGRYGPKSPTFKVSNSVLMGVMPVTTKARNWTNEEIDLYTKDPPNYTAANVHTGIGRDTPLVGDSKGGVALRYVEPKGRMLGLEFRLGEWENEKCVGGLTAVFTRDQPVTLPNRVLAKEGYAVAGAQVHAGKYVDGIKLLFQRVKDDGTFNPADSYASDWIGYAGAGQPQNLANDGRDIIGILIRQGAILNGFALVTAGDRPK
jgi:hypothetical protein